MVGSAALVAAFGLKAKGVATIGAMIAGLPNLRFDLFKPDLIRQLLGVAGGVATVSYTGVILDARIFASKNGYDVDADREFAALGVSQIASAVSEGFCVGSLDSGAALVDVAKGRTQLAGLISVGTIVVVMSLCMPLLAYVPRAALAVIVLSAAWAMTDIGYLHSLFRMSLPEFVVAISAMLGVITLGAVDALLLAVILALLRFLRLTSRPVVETLGEVPGTRGYHPLNRNPHARTLPGILIFRFNAPIVFFNASYFRKTVLDAVSNAGRDLRWFVLDAIPVSQIDVTGWHTLTELMEELEQRQTYFVIAGRRTQIRGYAEGAGIPPDKLASRLFPTVGTAVRHYFRESPPENKVASPTLGATDSD